MKLKNNFAKAVKFYIKKKIKLFELLGNIKKNKHQEYQHLLGV